MSKEEFIRKHKPLTKKEIEEKFKLQEEAKKSMTTDAVVLEKNLMDFNKISDPLIDPATGKVLCWIRRPTQQEWEEMLPTELLEYKNKLEEIPTDIWTKYKDLQFEMMAKLIVNPEHTAQEWKERSNLVFQQLFQIHLAGILELLGITAENF
jgi:hypothetical protein